MSIFKSFEREVVKALVSQYLADDQIEMVLDSASFVSYDYTGYGYFITVRHPIIQTERIVFDRPLLIGKAGIVECGFVVFQKNGELTLECHSWGDANVQADFRERQVEITILA